MSKSETIAKPKIGQIKDYEVMKATKKIDNVSVSFSFIKHQDAYKGIFLVKSISCKGKEIWSFKEYKERNKFKGLAKLCGFEENLFIVLDHFGITKVIPVADILFGAKSSVQQLLDLKIKLSEVMQIQPIFSEEEEKLLKKRD